MKILIINGSPRKKNTWAMVKRAKSILGEAEFEEVQLMKEKIPMCNGCFKCIMEGEENCPHHDQINKILEKLRNAGKNSAKVQTSKRRSKNEKYFCELCEKYFKFKRGSRFFKR